MADLFARATQLNMSPVVWELGFFALRDLIGTKDPAFRDRDWSQVRLETIWGCGISIETLGDGVVLVARGALVGSDAEFHRLTAGSSTWQE